MAGRPTKFSKTRADTIVNALRGWNYRKTACAFARVGYNTFLRWMEKGAAAKSGVYRDFRERVELAEAEAEIEAVLEIREAAKAHDYKAAIEFLARRHPKRWAARTRMSIGTTDADPDAEDALVGADGTVEIHVVLPSGAKKDDDEEPA